MTKTPQTPMTTAAQAVRDVLATIERIEGQRDGLQEKSRGVDELRAKHDALCEQKAQQLEAAALDGRTADTQAIEKEIVTAARALEKKQDEALGVVRALETVEKRLAAAQSTLGERNEDYSKRRAEHVLARARECIALVRKASGKFPTAVGDVLAILALLPHERLIEGEREFITEHSALHDEVMKIVREQWDLCRAAQGQVTLQTQADLLEADTLAGVSKEPEPEYHRSEPLYAWRDGTLHSEEEPKPAEPPATTIHVGKVNRVESPPGMPGVRTL